MAASEAKPREDDIRPSCPVSRQCEDKDYREVKAAAVSPTYDPCLNAECFADGAPEPDELVAVAHGRSSNKMHSPGSTSK